MSSHIQEVYRLNVLSKRSPPPLPWTPYPPMTNDHPFQCPYPECSNLFGRPIDLIDHMQICHLWSATKYWCQWPDCNYKATRVTALASHLRVHSTNKPYKCEWPACTYRARFPSNLKAHYVSHGDWRPFACEWPDCGQRFKSKDAAKRHTVKLHKEDRPPDNYRFVCHRHNCFKLYKTLSGLTRHVKSTHTSATSSQIPVPPEIGKSPAPDAIEVTTHTCYVPGCEYSASTASALRYHCLIH